MRSEEWGVRSGGMRCDELQRGVDGWVCGCVDWWMEAREQKA